MYRTPLLKTPEQKQIEEIFSEYNNQNRTTTSLANLLNSVIHTALSGEIKFLFELLQNADDAEKGLNPFEPTPVKVDIIFENSYLIFRHNGKHFDTTDVDKICRSSALQFADKRNDATKTGYKNIGFKTLFSVSNFVAIFSNKYSFKFDKDAFYDPQLFPWQMMPIWIQKENLPSYIMQHIDDEKVNFVLKINDEKNLLTEFNYLIENPQLMLFLRRINCISVTTAIKQNYKYVINRTQNPVPNSNFIQTKLTINATGLASSIIDNWIIRSFELDIPDSVQVALQKLDDSICPQRLKTAKKTSLYYAVKFKNVELIAEKNNSLFSTLPTGEKSGLPFLVNAEFLLNQDRTELLDVAWNSFLLEKIGLYQFHWLRELNKLQHLYKHVLSIFFMENLKIKNNAKQLQTAFAKGIQEGVEAIAWLPAFASDAVLLKLKECVLDETGFFSRFLKENLDGSIIQKLISSDLVNAERLSVHISVTQKFTLEKLLSKLEIYLLKQKNNNFNYQILSFLKEISSGQYNNKRALIAQTKCILTSQGTVIKPYEAFLPGKNNFIVPTIFSENLIHPEIIGPQQELYMWLREVEAKETSRIQIIRGLILRMVKEDAIPHQHNVEIVRFIFSAFCNNELTVNDYEELSYLKLHTQGKTTKAARFCYFSDNYNPIRKMEKNINEPSYFISPIYIDSNPPSMWKKFFLKLEVKENINIHLIPSYERPKALKEKPFMEKYLAHLRLEYQAPAKVPKPVNNHRLINFVDVDFLEWMTFPYYIEQLVSIIKEQWGEIKKNCDEAAYKYSNKTVPVISFLQYYFKEIAQFYDVAHKPCLAKKLYAPYLSEVVGDLYPTSSLKIQITPEQAAFLGFNTLISAAHILELFTYFQKNREKAQPKKYEVIFSHLLQLKIEEKEKFKKNSAKIYLFAEDNTLQPVNKLSYIDDLQFRSSSNSESFLKSYPSLTHEQMLQICQLFPTIQIIQSSTKKIMTKGAVEENSVQAFFLEKLPLIALQETIAYDEDPNKILINLCTLLMKIKCYSVDLLLVQFSEKIPALEKSYCRRDDTLYYVGRWNKSSSKYPILTEISTYLNIKSNLLEIYKLKEEQEISTWLRQKSFSSEIYRRLQRLLSEQNSPVMTDVSLSFTNSEVSETSQDTSQWLIEEEKEETELEDIEESFSTLYVTPLDEKIVNNTKLVSPNVSPINSNNSGSKRNKKYSSNTSASNFNFSASRNSNNFNNANNSKNNDTKEEKALKDLPATVNLNRHGFFAKMEGKGNKNLNNNNVTPKKLEILSPNSSSNLSNSLHAEKNTAAGPWSEELVYLYLKNYYKNRLQAEVKENPNGFTVSGIHPELRKFVTVNVIWFNKQGETYQSADLKIEKSYREKPTIIEVKGTTSNDKHSFEISSSEVRMMYQYEKQYQIYRVFNAGKKELARIEKLKNPVEEIKNSRISLEPSVYEMKFS